MGALQIEQIYREEFGRILSTLIRLLGSFEEAQEVVQDTFAAALVKWPGEGMPEQPRAWLFRTARNKAIDQLRRRTLTREKREEFQALSELLADRDLPAEASHAFPDDRLRLIFTCCHPALAMEAQVALTLHTLCGLTTEQIASAFLIPVPTLAQRITRAKARIRETGIPYRMPPPELLGERLDAVMVVVYLVFSEGYAASSGESLLRRDLCAEAIRLARLLLFLLGEGPGRPEVQGLLALMLAHDARAEARTGAGGEILLLEDQDRSRWKQEQIREAAKLVEEALRGKSPPGPYALQAAIATLHSQAPTKEDTDWPQIAALYAILLRVQPTPIVELNHAVAVALAHGLEQGLQMMDALALRGSLSGYHLLPAARADLLRRLGRWSEAAAAYSEALGLCKNQAERDFLLRRLALAENEAAVAGRASSPGS